jgi:hypothetical protein
MSIATARKRSRLEFRIEARGASLGMLRCLGLHRIHHHAQAKKPTLTAASFLPSSEMPGELGWWPF